MKIQDQVCTKEQAQKIRLLGVAQVAHFFHVFRTKPNEFWNIEHLGTATESWQSPQNEYAAYTVAELGEMLPDLIEQESKQYELVCIKEDECWLCRYVRNNDMLDCFHYAAGKTEAEARANMLEYLIESKLITIEETNNRLTCAPKK